MRKTASYRVLRLSGCIYGISGIYVKYGICGIYGKYGWTQLFYCMLFEVFVTFLTFGIVIFCMNSVLSYNIVS